ncbi:MAG TPA: hypothetical protein PKB06_01005, partial [Actinotalea sp.]|nr:hypothetical protein [Actinotalea sp.]
APTAQPAAQPAPQPALPARTGSPTWTDEDAEDDVRSPAWSGPSTDPEDHELPAPVSLAEHPRDEPAAADAQDEADADEDLDGQDEAFGDAPPVLSGVPQWSPVRTPAAEPPVQQVEPEPEPARPLHHVVQHPATPTAPAGVPAMVPQRGAPEDHDGLTVLSSDVVALRRQLPEWAGDAVPQLAVPTPRTPAPAKLLMSTGLVVSLNRPVLIGRAPQVTRVTNNEVPRLITVASPNQDISRTHAEVRMDGEEVVFTDLR